MVSRAGRDYRDLLRSLHLRNQRFSPIILGVFGKYLHIGGGMITAFFCLLGQLNLEISQR